MGETARIKEVIMDLSKTFPEAAVGEESLAEEAVRQVASLSKGLQVKVSKLEARMIPSTPQ